MNDLQLQEQKSLVTPASNSASMEIMEHVLMAGDLAGLTPQQRVDYYGAVCQSVGLNPLTKPFDYIRLNNKLTLYAKKDCADQLRSINGVSVTNLTTDISDGMIIVTANVTDRHGRSDSDVGVVTVGNLQGDKRANAIMKAVTKAKRRATLSLCGLGWLDETEIETIPNSGHVKIDHNTGELLTPNDDQENDSPYSIGEEVLWRTEKGEAFGVFGGVNEHGLYKVRIKGKFYSAKPENVYSVGQALDVDDEGEQSELPIEIEEVVEASYE